MRTRYVPILLLILSIGCASNHYDTFRAKNPDSWLDWPPPTGAGMHEVLAGLYAPPQGRWQRSVPKIDVLRLGDGGPTKLSEDEIAALLQGEPEGAYAIVAVQGCLSVEGISRYQGQKVAWFIFPTGQLHAWDAFNYVEHCTVTNLFNPASTEHVEMEKQALAWSDAHFPKSMAHTAQFYQQGLIYLTKGRLNAAKSSLEQGNETIDVGASGRGGGRRDFGKKGRVTQVSDVERLRRRLTLAIAEAESATSER